MQSVPFIDLARCFRPELSASGNEDLLSTLTETWKRQLMDCEFVEGPTVGKLETAVAEDQDTREFVACANGTDAIILGLQALGIKPGMKLALPNLTFWATYEAVAQIGAIPVLIDIDPDDLQMSFDELKQAHDKLRLDGVVLVHLYGWASARLNEFREFCADARIPLLEDGAQSYGVRAFGDGIYSGATLATLSFYPAKVFGGVTDGGGIFTRDPALAGKCRLLKNHGRSTHFSYSAVGWNSRMAAMQAAALLALLPRIGGFIRSRRMAADIYRARLTDGSGIFKVFSAPQDIEENGYLNVIQLLKHDPADIAGRLYQAGIGSGRVYPGSLDMQPPAKDALRISGLDHSRRVARSVINLPLFAGITEAEVLISADAFMEAVEIT